MGLWSASVGPSLGAEEEEEEEDSSTRMMQEVPTEVVLRVVVRGSDGPCIMVLLRKEQQGQKGD